MLSRASVPARMKGRTIGARNKLARALAQFGFHAPLTEDVFLDKGYGAASFTRATTATVVDHEGCIRNCLSGEVRFHGQRRVRNWLAVPEDFSSATWTTIAGGTGTVPTKTANYASAPDGTTTACRVQATVSAGTASGDYSLMRQAATYAGTGAVGSVWMKSNTGASQVVIVSYDEVVVVTVTTSWQRFSWPRTVGSNHFDIGCRGDSAANKTIDVLVWHPQMEALVGASNQNPSEYVSVGAAKLNELRETENVGTSPWVLTNATITNGVAATNPTVHLQKVASTAAGLTRTMQDWTATATTYCITLYGKKGTSATTANGFRFRNNTTPADLIAFTINWDTGVITHSLGSGVTSVDCGDGVWRIVIPVSSGVSVGNSLRIYALDFTAGAGGEYAYIGGVQATPGTTSATTYFPVGNVYPFHGAMVDGVRYYDYQNSNSVASNVVTEGTTRTPCLGYTSGSWTNSAVGYLPESARTNLVLQSSNFGTTWGAIGTPTRSAAAAYCGDIALDLIGDDSAAAIEGYSQAITFTGDATKSVSFLVKQGTSTSSMVRLVDTTAVADRLLVAITWSSGVPVLTYTTGSSERATTALGNGVYRCHALTSSVTAANTNVLQVLPASDAALAVANTGDCYIGGVQAENATTASVSHIPTTTATVTRNADDLRYPAAGNILGTVGSAYAEAPGGTGPAIQGRFVDSGGTGIPLMRSGGTGAVLGFNDGATTVTIGALNGGFSTTPYKVACAWGSSLVSGAVNATLDSDNAFDGDATLTTAIVPGGSASTGLEAPIRNVRVSTQKISNADLQLITQ